MDSNPKKRIRPHHYRTGQMTLLRRHFELTRLALCGVQCPSTIHVVSAAPRTAFRNTLSLKLCLLSSACHFIHSCFHFRPLSGHTTSTIASFHLLSRLQSQIECQERLRLLRESHPQINSSQVFHFIKGERAKRAWLW